jgi:RND family efflux transporter MFP subunit
MKKIFLIIPLVILMAGGVILLKKRKHAIAEAPVAKPMTHTIRTVQAETKTVAQAATFLAKLEATNSASISSKLSGRISKLAVRESQQVHRGDLLVRIDATEIQAAIKGLQAQLVAARDRRKYTQTQYERDLALYNAGGLSKEKLEASRLNSSTARSAVLDLEQKIKSQQNQLNYLQITAPFDGTVGTILQRQGDLAAPGKPLLTLNSQEQKLTFSFMPDSEHIQPGQEVLLQSTGAKIGTIVNLYNDAKNGLSVAEVGLDAPIERPNNAYLSIRVVENQASGCAVPVRALLHRKDGTSIMVFRDDHFSSQPVEVSVLGEDSALISPCPREPVAVAAEAKLSLLPTYGRIRIIAGESNE